MMIYVSTHSVHSPSNNTETGLIFVARVDEEDERGRFDTEASPIVVAVLMEEDIVLPFAVVEAVGSCLSLPATISMRFASISLSSSSLNTILGFDLREEEAAAADDDFLEFLDEACASFFSVFLLLTAATSSSADNTSPPSSSTSSSLFANTSKLVFLVFVDVDDFAVRFDSCAAGCCC